MASPLRRLAAVVAISSAIHPAPSSSLFLPDALHTSVSSQHQRLPCLRNTLLPRNDCPNKASLSNRGTAETLRSQSFFSLSPSTLTPIPLGVPSPEGGHDPGEHSVQLCYNLFFHYGLEYSC